MGCRPVSARPCRGTADSSAQARRRAGLGYIYTGVTRRARGICRFAPHSLGRVCAALDAPHDHRVEHFFCALARLAREHGGEGKHHRGLDGAELALGALVHVRLSLPLAFGSLFFLLFIFVPLLGAVLATGFFGRAADGRRVGDVFSFRGVCCRVLRHSDGFV